MTLHGETPKSAYMAAAEMLLIVSDVELGDAAELFIAIGPDGRVMAFNGHVDLGTGIRTSLAQIVAEELHVPFEQVDMVLGATSVAPNQGATIASETIQITAIPLRHAAATARRHLLVRASMRTGTPVEKLILDDGSRLLGTVAARPTIQAFRDEAENEGMNGLLRLDDLDSPVQQHLVWLDRIREVRPLPPIEP